MAYRLSIGLAGFSRHRLYGCSHRKATSTKNLLVSKCVVNLSQKTSLRFSSDLMGNDGLY